LQFVYFLDFCSYLIFVIVKFTANLRLSCLVHIVKQTVVFLTVGITRTIWLSEREK